MASDLDNLKASYSNICAQIAEITRNPKPTYSEKGRTVSWGELFRNLMDARAELEKVPGVAPVTKPIFDVVSVGR